MVLTDSVGSADHPESHVGRPPDLLPTAPNKSSVGCEVVDVEPELKLDVVPHADADLSGSVIPENSSTLTPYWAAFENVSVIVPADANDLTLRADSTSKRSPAPDVFWSRSIAYVLPAASVAATALLTDVVDLSSTEMRRASPATTCRLAARLTLVVAIADAALATRPTYEIPVAARDWPPPASNDNAATANVGAHESNQRRTDRPAERRT